MLRKSLSALEIVLSSWVNQPKRAHNSCALAVMTLLWNLNGSFRCFDCADILIAPVNNTIWHLWLFDSHSHWTSCEDRSCKYNTDYFHYVSQSFCKLNGDGRGTRTHDRVVNSHLLYQLSYAVKGWQTTYCDSFLFLICAARASHSGCRRLISSWPLRSKTMMMYLNIETKVVTPVTSPAIIKNSTRFVLMPTPCSSLRAP